MDRATLNDEQLIATWRACRRKANEAEAEMYEQRDEADEIGGMLAARGYRLDRDEWRK